MSDESDKAPESPDKTKGKAVSYCYEDEPLYIVRDGPLKGGYVSILSVESDRVRAFVSGENWITPPIYISRSQLKMIPSASGLVPLWAKIDLCVFSVSSFCCFVLYLIAAFGTYFIVSLVISLISFVVGVAYVIQGKILSRRIKTCPMCATLLDLDTWSHCDACGWNRPLPTFMDSEVYDPHPNDESDKAPEPHSTPAELKGSNEPAKTGETTEQPAVEMSGFKAFIITFGVLGVCCVTFLFLGRMIKIILLGLGVDEDISEVVGVQLFIFGGVMSAMYVYSLGPWNPPRETKELTPEEDHRIRVKYSFKFGLFGLMFGLLTMLLADNINDTARIIGVMIPTFLGIIFGYDLMVRVVRKRGHPDPLDTDGQAN